MSLQHNQMKVFNAQRRLILKTPLSKNRTFKIGIQELEQKCFGAVVDDVNWLWHYRFGHLNFRSLNLLQKKGMVQGLPQVNQPEHVCDDCCISKQPRKVFKNKAPHRSEDKLEVIYSDVCRPFEVHSLGVNSYFVSFIDEYIRMLWIYLIKRRVMCCLCSKILF